MQDPKHRGMHSIHLLQASASRVARGLSAACLHASWAEHKALDCTATSEYFKLFFFAPPQFSSSLASLLQTMAILSCAVSQKLAYYLLTAISLVLECPARAGLLHFAVLQSVTRCLSALHSGW